MAAAATTIEHEMVNRYPGSCVDCTGRVEAGAGVARKIAGKWHTAHLAGACTAKPAVNWVKLAAIRERAEARAVEQPVAA